MNIEFEIRNIHHPIGKFDSFTMLPDDLMTGEIFKQLSLHAKILYCNMLNLTNASREKHLCNENGDIYIFYTYEKIMEYLNCSRKTASRLIKELVDFGLIIIEKKDFNQAAKIYVNNYQMIEYQIDTPNTNGVSEVDQI